MPDIWPTDIKIRDGGRVLTISFDDGSRFDLSAEMLRVMSPSAEVQGHSPQERIIVGGKQFVAVETANPVGNYAIKLGFDDGHSTGIYTWDYLATLGREKDERWAHYLADLEKAGLARDKLGSKAAATLAR